MKHFKILSSKVIVYVTISSHIYRIHMVRNLTAERLRANVSQNEWSKTKKNSPHGIFEMKRS